MDARCKGFQRLLVIFLALSLVLCAGCGDSGPSLQAALDQTPTGETQSPDQYIPIPDSTQPEPAEEPTQPEPTQEPAPTEAPPPVQTEPVEAAQSAPIPATLDPDSNARIPMADGTVVAIAGPVDQAFLTSDRNTIVVLLEDGTLYSTNPNLKNRKVISRDVEGLSLWDHPRGFLYEAGGKDYLYSYASGASQALPESDQIISGQQTLTLLACEEEYVFLLTEGTVKPTELGKYDGEIRLMALSDDGSTALWSVLEDGTCTVWLWENGSVSSLSSAATGSSLPMAASLLPEDRSLLVVANENLLTIKQAGQAPVTHTLPAPIHNPQIGSDGYLYLTVTAKSGVGLDLYALAPEGQPVLIAGGLRSYFLCGDRIFYQDSFNSLCMASLDGVALSGTVRVATGATVLAFLPEVQRVFYMTNMEDVSQLCTAGTLFSYDLSTGKSMQVGVNVGTQLLPGLDGKTLFYWEDLVPMEDFTATLGILVQFNISEGTWEKIADNCDYDLDYTTSGLRSGRLDKDNFFFRCCEDFREGGWPVYSLWQHTAQGNVQLK